MKGLRTTFIAAIAIGLVAGSAVGATAQDEDADGLAPALASGTMAYPNDEPVSHEGTRQDGIVQEQWVDIADVEMSDPRLTGMLTLEFTKQRFDGNGTDLAWGSARIENDGGDWTGKMVQTSDPLTVDGGEVAYYELVGSGAYEGLSAVVFEAEVFPAREREWSAIIFPGDLPPDR